MKTLNEHYREKFGCKVYKLSLDGGFTCPNRDGTVGIGGCIFCSASGGGEFAEKGCESIEAQLEKAKARVQSKNRNGKYIAYFQSFTNTYGPEELLRERYLSAIGPEEIVGLSIGTRPDCLGEDVMAVLKEVNAVKPVSVELGLQTIHEASARYIRRGYENDVYFDAVRRLKEANIEVVTHIILGLPGETPEMMKQTTKEVMAAGTDGVKFHLLHVLRGTDLEALIAGLEEPAESKEIRMNILTEDFKTYGQKVIDELTAYAETQPGWSLAPSNYEGVRVNIGSGWFLLRLSLHDPLLPLNIEANEAGGAKEIAKELAKFLASYDQLDAQKFLAFAN